MAISTHAPHTGRDVATARTQIGYVISTHAPHTGRDLLDVPSVVIMPISTHAPHTGRDWVFSGAGALTEIFQPTRPIRGATPATSAPRWRTTYFNPRAPYGARRYRSFHYAAPSTFQPTRPIRGAT